MLDLSQYLTIEDLPELWQDYAKQNGINNINDFSIVHLFKIYDKGAQIYINRLSNDRAFMKRLIKEHFPNAPHSEIQKNLPISRNHLYSLQREMHDETVNKTSNL